MTSMALLWAASMGVAAAMADGPLRDALERGILAHALDSRVESARQDVRPGGAVSVA